MAAATTYRRSLGDIHGQPLKQFVHDSRTDVIAYAGFGSIQAGGPFRNGDIAPIGATQSDVSATLRFTSAGGLDEWVTGAMAADTDMSFRIYLNGQLVAERVTTQSLDRFSTQVLVLRRDNDFYQGGDFFADYFLKVRPSRGVNTLTLVKSASNGAFYFDGFGLNLRGGPLPLTP